jgi:hypothetical protein
MAFVSVFAFSEEKVFDEGTALAWTAVDDDDDAALAADDDDAAVFAGVAAFGAGAGVAAGSCEGAGAGLDPPMLREMVGGAAGASVCSGRSIGAGCCSAGCWGMRNACPGTNENAPGLSLLIVVIVVVVVGDELENFWSRELIAKRALISSSSQATLLGACSNPAPATLTCILSYSSTQ